MARSLSIIPAPSMKMRKSFCAAMRLATKSARCSGDNSFSVSVGTCGSTTSRRLANCMPSAQKLAGMSHCLSETTGEAGRLADFAARLAFAAALVDPALVEFFAAFFDFPDFVAISLPSYSQVVPAADGGSVIAEWLSRSLQPAFHEFPYRKSKPEPWKMLLKFLYDTPFGRIVKNFVRGARHQSV